jgi:hypothetical protein
VVEVLKIRPMQNGVDDMVAWHYERSGIFTVKSAYQLAVELKQTSEDQAGSSSGSTDGRPIYREIRRADVPPKLCIFAWNWRPIA